MEIPRLNGVIRALERGQTAFVGFSPVDVENAIALAGSSMDGVALRVKGIGVVLIGEGDLSQEIGHPRDYEHPVVAEAIDRILKICQDHGVPCGHPHPDARNIERLIAQGYRFLMPPAPRSFAVLEQGRKLAGRS